MDAQASVAEFDDFPVAENPVDRDRSERHAAAEVRIAETAVFENPAVVGRGPHFGSGDFLDFGQRRGVIPVGLHGQQDPDVFKPIAQRFDVRADERRGILKSRVDQDVAFVGSDQKHAEAVRANRVEIPDDPVSRKRSGPIGVLSLHFAGRSSQKHGGENGGDCCGGPDGRDCCGGSDGRVCCGGPDGREEADELSKVSPRTMSECHGHAPTTFRSAAEPAGVTCAGQPGEPAL